MYKTVRNTTGTHNPSSRPARIGLLMLVVFLVMLGSSCKHDDESFYPNIISEMADLYTNDGGSITHFVIDDGREYHIENPKSGFQPKSRYRVLCGYVPSGSNATVYQLEGVIILRDSTEREPKRDPVNVVSAWRTPRYVNLHLAAKGQSLPHYWGFITDSVTITPQDAGDTLVHAYLSLYHDQCIDPRSYTIEQYASLPLDSIPSFKSQSGSITLSVTTYGGTKTIEL